MNLTAKAPVKLKIYTDKSYFPTNERHIVLLFPFWGLLPEPAGDKDAGRFDDYALTGKEFIDLVPSLDEADVAVLPFEWSPGNKVYKDLAGRLANEAGRKGKRIVIFFNNDSDEPIPIDNAVIFRTSFYRSTRKPNEFAFPGWSVDFFQRYLGNKLPIRKKGDVPVVGYCGYIDYAYSDPKSLLRQAARLATGKKRRIGSYLRGKAVRSLQLDPRLQMNFIYRSGFGGTSDDSIREDYVNNITESDYALVVRGAGNFSYRLYEVLSCGRIPVFIDTDCVLPFDNIIDWKKYCVWVDVSELDSLADKICEFHQKIPEIEFEELQRSIRDLYENWICPVGFYRNIWRNIKTVGSSG